MPDINQNEKALQNATLRALVSAVGKATDMGRYTTSGKSKEYALKQYASNIQILGQSARVARVGEETAVNKWSLVTPRLTIDAKNKNDVSTMVKLIDEGLSKILKEGKLGGLPVSDLISVDGLTVSMPQMTIKGTDISSAINKELATKEQFATKNTSKSSQVPAKNIARSDSMVKPIARPVQQDDKTTIKQEKPKVSVETQVNAGLYANASVDAPRHTGAKIVKPIRGGGGNNNWADKVSASVDTPRHTGAKIVKPIRGGGGKNNWSDKVSAGKQGDSKGNSR